MIYINLPPSPTPKSFTAWAPVRTLGEHSRAFWSFYNPRGIDVHLSIEEEADELEVARAELCEIECLEALPDHSVVKILDGKFKERIARLPVTWMAWEDRKSWHVGDRVFAVVLPEAKVERHLGANCGLIVSRCHNLFFFLLVKRLTGKANRCLITSAAHTGAIIVDRTESIAPIVGRSGNYIRALTRLAGLERVIVCRSVDPEKDIKLRVWKAMGELYGENRSQLGLRAGMYKGLSVAVIRGEETERRWLFGKGGATLNLLSVLSGTPIVVLPPEVKLQGFLRFADIQRYRVVAN